MLPDEARRLIRRSIRSIWALELLLLLRRERHSRTSAELVRDLQSSHSAVEDILALFRQTGLVADAAGGKVHYHATADLDRAAGALEQAYAERPLAVIKEIVSAPNERLKTFADAFKLKRD